MEADPWPRIGPGLVLAAQDILAVPLIRPN